MTSMTIADLTAKIKSGEVDTVVVAMTDMQGRLTGKRIHGTFFLDEVLKHIPWKLDGAVLPQRFIDALLIGF